MLKTGIFPDKLNLSDINPVFKKKDPLLKVDYRSISVLPSISIVFEKLMQKQISGYLSNYLSAYFSSQQALLPPTENWKKVLDKKGFWRSCINGPI